MRMKYHKFRNVRQVDKAIKKNTGQKEVLAKLRSMRKEVKKSYVRSVEVYY